MPETQQIEKDVNDHHEFSNFKFEEEFRKRGGSHGSFKSRSRSRKSSQISVADNTELETNLKETVRLLTLGLRHRTEEVLVLSAEKRETSMYHALFATILESLEDILSINKEALSVTLKKLRKASDIANNARKKSWTKWLTRPDYDSYTEEEIHAELVYGHSLIVMSMVSVLADQSILGFLNAAICAKTSYQTYQECYNILKYRKTWSSQISKRHFENAVRLAMGGFDLVISYLPSKLIKLLEFAGFSGDRSFGLRELAESEEIGEGLLWPVTVIVMAVYHLFLELVFGLGETDIHALEDLTSKASARYPDSGYFMVFKAMYELVSGDINGALEHFNQCVHSDGVPQVIKYACHLFMAWANVLLCKWSEAAKCAKVLQSCNWSPSSSYYVYAICLSMVMDEECGDIKGDPQIDQRRDYLRNEISDALRKVPSLKRTFGGKKAFHEKLVLGRSKAFVDDPDELLLAPFEVAYIFNFVQWTNGDKKIIDPILAKIEAKLESFKNGDNDFDRRHFDKLSYLTFLKGVFLKLSGNYTQALALFSDVLKWSDRIADDHHVPAQAAYETGMVYRAMQNYELATEWLNRAKTEYSGHYAEAMINYRADLALETMKNVTIKAHHKEPRSRSGSLISSFLTRRFSGPVER